MLREKQNWVKNQVGEKTSQRSFQKAFKPITTKLDDVALGNLKLPALQRKRGKKMAVRDYGIPTYDEDIPDYALDNLSDDEEIRPQQNKHLVPKPPSYEESLADVLEGKKNMYVDPQYLSTGPQDLPPEYDEDEVPDYDLDEEDRTN